MDDQLDASPNVDETWEVRAETGSLLLYIVVAVSFIGYAAWLIFDNAPTTLASLRWLTTPPGRYVVAAVSLGVGLALLRLMIALLTRPMLAVSNDAVSALTITGTRHFTLDQVVSVRPTARLRPRFSNPAYDDPSLPDETPGIEIQLVAGKSVRMAGKPREMTVDQLRRKLAAAAQRATSNTMLVP